MRNLRLVSGTGVDWLSLFLPQRSQTKRSVLTLDVSHLRHGGFDRSSFKADPKMECVRSRYTLHNLHLFCRVLFWIVAEKTQQLPMGLQRLALPDQRRHPARLCSAVVHNRSAVRKTTALTDHFPYGKGCIGLFRCSPFAFQPNLPVNLHRPGNLL